jgi:hypothetical protein
VARREALLALAWAAPLTTGQLRRLVAPVVAPNHFRSRLLAPLVAAGLVTPVAYAANGGVGHRLPERRVPPRAVGRVWELSAAGHAEVASLPGAPSRRAVVRRSMLGHDLVLSEVVTRVVEWTRPFLSGLYLEHEERLDEGRRRPIADAMLVVRYGADVVPGVVPWRVTAPPPGQHVRLYAIEVDRGTEGYDVVHEKAASYRRVRDDPAFYERYGRMFPVLLVTVPSESRRRAWHAGWRERWPEGFWLIATEAGLARDEWLEHRAGVERWRTFADGWAPAEGEQPPIADAGGGAHETAAAGTSGEAGGEESQAPGYWARRLRGVAPGSP